MAFLVPRPALRARSALGAWFSAALALGAAVPARAEVRITLDRSPIILGKTESVAVVFHVDEPEGSRDQILRVAANAGSFGPVTRAGLGLYRATYVPPSTRFPQVALVAVWRETGPDAPVDFLSIPLWGTTRVPVPAKRGAEVMVELGGAKFGPVVADKRGQAEVPVLVPPGATEAEATISVPGSQKPQGRTIALPVVPYNHLIAAVVPHALSPGSAQKARLHVYYDVKGAQVTAEWVKVRATVGELTLERAAEGRITYRYAPPRAGDNHKRAELQATVPGDAAAKASTEVALEVPPAAHVRLKLPESAIPADGRSIVPMEVRVLDDVGMGLGLQKVSISTNGDKLVEVADLGNGVYRANYTAPSSYPPSGLIHVVATVEGFKGNAQGNYQLASPQAPGSVVARLEPNPVPADGRTQAALYLELKDAAGKPVSGAQLVVLPTHGTVSNVSEVGAGQYRATYTPPSEAPAGEASIRILDPVSSYEEAVPIWLRPGRGRLVLGVRGGYTQGTTNLGETRGGLELALPLRLGGFDLAVGVTAMYGRASQSGTSPSGLALSQVDAQFVPVTLRMTGDLFGNRWVGFYAGVGAVATWANFNDSLLASRASTVGFGGTALAGAALLLGPGQLFLEVAGSIAPLRARSVGAGTAQYDYALDVGGTSVEAGYRMAVLR